VSNDVEFRQQVTKLGELIGQIDQFPDGPQKVASRQVVELLMEIHGAGLERMMEVVFESCGDGGQKVIDELGQDSMISSLLLLYSLHPDNFDTRISRALDRLRPRLRKLACTAELVSSNDGEVTVRLATAGHSCGSSTSEMRAMVEEGIFEFAPDLTALHIEGLEEPAAAGFVALESLLGSVHPGPVRNGHLAESVAGD
jgi:Fe-S cluster biogenesis protein NfuA